MAAHVPPPMVSQLTVADFAILILGLDARSEGG
jgi:hypothetical protein